MLRPKDQLNFVNNVKANKADSEFDFLLEYLEKCKTVSAANQTRKFFIEFTERFFSRKKIK
jgi:hypothetical protein